MFLPEYECRCSQPLGEVPENYTYTNPGTGQSVTWNPSFPSGGLNWPLPVYSDKLKWASAADQGVKVAFPYEIKPPHFTGNLRWSGRVALINVGLPRWRNDPDEYIRSAMVDSDWDAVEKWLAWKVVNGMKYEDIPKIHMGEYKHVIGGGRKTWLPFSDADYRTFFERFKRFANGDPASERCIRDSIEGLRKLENSQRHNPANVPHQLYIGVCPVRGVWWKGFLIMAASVAALYGAATLLSGALQSVGAAGAGQAGAAGASSAAGATGATEVAASTAASAAEAAASSAGTLGLETVTITAAPIASLSTGAAGALTAGAVGAGAIASGAGAGGAGAIEAPLETVDVIGTAPTAPGVTVSPIEAVGAAASVANAASGTGMQDGPTRAEPREPNASERSIQDQLIDWLKKQGINWSQEQIAAWLAGQWARAPSDDDVAYVQGGARQNDSIITKVLPYVAVLFALAIALPEKER